MTIVRERERESGRERDKMKERPEKKGERNA